MVEGHGKVWRTMTCLYCTQGNTNPGVTTVTLQRGQCTVIIKGCPAELCDNCGDYYVAEDVTRKLLHRAELAVKNGAEIEILAYAA